MSEKKDHIPYDAFTLYGHDQRLAAQLFRQKMSKRRSTRYFSDRAVPQDIIEDIIMTASSAPSGAHKQPWSFAAVSNDGLKEKIRVAAEKEEYENYHGRMSDDWIEDLKVFDTDWHKEFITIAPWIIVVFKKPYDLIDGNRHKNYYVNESVGIASGMLLAAIQNAGLASLTHTPSPMNFLEKVLGRPDNERAVLLIPVGYPAEDCLVPDLTRKSTDEVITWY